MAITAAFVAQYLGFIPCLLCIYQRIPYGLMILTGIGGLIYSKYFKLWLIILIIFQLTSIFISGYHSSIEMGLLPPLSSCSNHLDYAKMSLDEIKTRLNTFATPNCATPAIVILSLSMAQWNLIFSSLLLTLIVMLFRYKNAKTIL
jgi:disulfide bond formation protein DsbB